LSNKEGEFYDGIKFYKDPHDDAWTTHATLIVEGDNLNDADAEIRAKDMLNQTLDKLAYSCGMPYQKWRHFRAEEGFRMERVDENAILKHKEESSKAPEPSIDISRINNVKDEKKYNSLLKALGYFRKGLNVGNVFDAFLSFWQCIEVIIREEIGKKEVRRQDWINFLKDSYTPKEFDELYGGHRSASVHAGIDVSSHRKEEDFEKKLYKIYDLAKKVISEYLKKYSTLSVM